MGVATTGSGGTAETGSEHLLRRVVLVEQTDSAATAELAITLDSRAGTIPTVTVAQAAHQVVTAGPATEVGEVERPQEIKVSLAVGPVAPSLTPPFSWKQRPSLQLVPDSTAAAVLEGPMGSVREIPVLLDQ